MSPLKLADILDDCSPWVATNEGWEAAATLRVQHDLILKLSTVINHINTEMYLDDYGHFRLSMKYDDTMVLSALDAIKEYDTSNGS